HHPVAAIASYPCRPIPGRTIVVLMIAVLDPLEHVTGHIVEAERIRLERSDRCGLLAVPLAAAAVAGGVLLANLVAPEIGGSGAGARRVFPFGLGEQPVYIAGHLGEPSDVGLGVTGRVPRPQPRSRARPGSGQPPTATQSSQSAKVTSN